MAELYSDLQVHDDLDALENESQLYSDWVNELNHISGFRIQYVSRHIHEESLYSNEEAGFEDVSAELFATGEFANADMGQFDMSSLFDGNIIQIHIPFKEFQDNFAEKIPKSKDQVKFIWSDRWFSVTEAIRDEAELVFNYRAYAWKITLTLLKESSEITEEKHEVVEEVGKMEISDQDLTKIFFDDEFGGYGSE